MERRSCSNLHFINAIKGNLVSKLCNVNSCGKPALMFKKLNDIYNTGEMRTTSHSFLQSGSGLSSDRVKIESQCLPLAVRSLQEVHPARNEAVCSISDGETGNDSDDDIFVKMTLKQLKQKCKVKKRRRSVSVGLNPQHVHIKLEREDDESDLKVPLSSLKMKSPKAKKKCIRSSSESSELSVFKIKSEQGLDPESSVQFHGGLHSVTHVKTEVPEPELEGCQNSTPFVDETFTVNPTYESNIIQVINDGNSGRVECRRLEPDLDGEQYQSCTLNQVSYDHLEYVEPLCVLVPSFEDLMDVSNQEERHHQFLDMPSSEFGREGQIEQPLETISHGKDQSSDVNGCSGSCHLHEFSVQSSKPVVQVPELVVDDSTGKKEPYYGGESCLLQGTLNKKLTTNQQIATLGSPHRTCSSSWGPHPCSSTEEELLSSQDGKTEEKQQLKGNIIDIVNNNLNSENHMGLLEHELSSDEEKKTPISTKVHSEREYSSWNQNCAFEETHSPSAPVPTPGRLLSTRKVVSPTSQERYCLAMNSTESSYGTDLQDCKENLCTSKQTEALPFCEGSDKHDNASKIPKGPVAVSRTKFILSPSQVKGKTKRERTSPPKGNLEGPRLSRSLPRVTTGCTSVQGCSESAIAFSRRQMHDIESLATKLMSELKSMKEIVEEKLLFEAYRNVSLKNDADEVKNAITNVTKAEESARKWLSIMGRDCNRFCKIMSLTQKCTTPASADVVQRERKRISFADEAGGMLCHVKFFENGMASGNENQED